MDDSTLVRYFPDIIAALKEGIGRAISEPEYARTLTSIITTIADGKSEIIGLPVLACQAAGGDPKQAVPVAAAWTALRVAARLLDDVEDGDVAPKQYGPCTSPCIINLATGFIGIANLILSDSDENLTLVQGQGIIQSFNRMMVRMAEAQHLDLLPDGVQTLDAYWRHIEGKSGVFFGMGIRAGAMVGTLSQEALDRYFEFGYNLGVALQLVNDFQGFFMEGARSDLAAGKRTAPFFFIEDFAPSSVKRQMQELFHQAPFHQDARERLRQLAVDQGAAAYMLAEITRYRYRAIQSLRPEDDPDRILIHCVDRFAPLPEYYRADPITHPSISAPLTR